MSKHFLYVADPMCSWCWGFSPVIDKIDETFGETAPVDDNGNAAGRARNRRVEMVFDQD